MANTIELPKLLTEEEAAAAIGVRRTTMQAWRVTHRVFLPWIKVGRLVRYREADVLAFLESRLRGTQPPAA